MTDGLSDTLDLPGTNNVYFKFKDNQTIGKQWLLSVRKKPTVEPTALIESLEKLGEEADSVLYSTLEPYDTFRKLWLFHPYWNYRLTGAALALIYRTEDLRNV